MEEGLLLDAEIHGFLTASDLDIDKLMEDASSGTVLLFDRKMLRNFRKDGHNWKKKKDGKTVQEAHEKLKVRLREN